MMSKGGGVMNYNKITKTIAAEKNTTQQEVENEMKKAVEEAGLDFDPETLIFLIASEIKRNAIRKRII